MADRFVFLTDAGTGTQVAINADQVRYVSWIHFEKGNIIDVKGTVATIAAHLEKAGK